MDFSSEMGNGTVQMIWKSIAGDGEYKISNISWLNHSFELYGDW